MEAELGEDVVLHEDLVETIDGEDRFDHLDGRLSEQGAVERVRALSKDG